HKKVIARLAIDPQARQQRSVSKPAEAADSRRAGPTAGGDETRRLELPLDAVKTRLDQPAITRILDGASPVGFDEDEDHVTAPYPGKEMIAAFISHVGGERAFEGPDVGN